MLSDSDALTQLRTLVASPDAWYRDTEPAPAVRLKRMEAARLQWQARVWASLNGYRVVDNPAADPVVQDQRIECAGVGEMELMSVSLAARILGLHRVPIVIAVHKGIIPSVRFFGGPPKVRIADVRSWDARRKKDGRGSGGGRRPKKAA